MNSLLLNINNIEKMQYTSEYVSKINKGEIVIGKKIEKALNRLNHYLEKYEFDQYEVNRKIAFIETETSQTKGSKEQLKLALPQKVWLEIAWGFYITEEVELINPSTMEFEKQSIRHRVIHEVPLVMARGNGKTTLGSAIALAGQLVDKEEGADIQLLAYNREQAGFLFNAVKTMITRQGTILAKLNVKNKLRSTKQGIYHEPSNSLISIKTSDYETLDGTNAHYNIFDEVHTYDDDFIKVVNDGSAKKRLNWMTWYLTTNGTKRDALFDKYYKKWSNILDGIIESDSIFPLIYEIDSKEDVSDLDSNPDKTKNFQKANPMLNIMPSLTIKSILHDITLSKGDLSAQNEILAKTFNYPSESFGTYFSNEEINGNKELFDEEIFKGTEDKYVNVVIGADLSEVNDLTSISLLRVIDDKFYFKTYSFLPRNSLSNFSKERKKYMLEMHKKGNLILHDNDYNDQKEIYAFIKKILNENYLRPVLLAPDRWHADTFIEEYKKYHNYKVDTINQTVKVLSGPMKLYKTKLALGKVIFNNDLARFAHSNVVVKVDANGNIYPNKSKANDKIDPFMAQLDAFVGYINNEDHISKYES